MPIDLRNDVQFEHTGQVMTGLGSYWNEIFEDGFILKSILDAVQNQYRQADINSKEIILGADITQAPVYHTQVWYRHRIYRSQQADGNLLGPKYWPGSRQYGDGAQYGRGDPYLWMYELPTELVRPRLLCNRITDASFMAYENAGYYFAPGYIGLPFNPFASDLWPVVEDGGDQAIDLWFYLSDWDTQLLQRRYALAVAINAPSSDHYRLFLEGVWQGRMLDTGRSALYKILEGASGIPLAHANEEVRIVTTDGTWDIVVTDLNVYRVPIGGEVLVEVGDRLYRGQSIFSAFRLTSQQDWDGFDITLPPEFFNPEIQIRHPITFPNEDVPVTYVGQDEEGRTLYYFPLYGEGQDLIKYRQWLVESGFVHLLDTRGPDRITEPGASELVSTINPAVDLIARHMIPNLMLASVDQNLWPTDAGLQEHLEKEIWKFLPPHSRLLLQQEVPLSSESWSSWSSLSEGSESSSTVGTTESTLSSPSSTSSTESTSSTSSTSSSSVSPSSTSSSTFSESSQSTSSETSSSSSTLTSSSSVTESSKSSQSESSTSSSTRSSLTSESSTSSTNTSSSTSTETTSSTSSSSESSSSSTLWMSTQSTTSSSSSSESSSSNTSSSTSSSTESSESTVSESSISSSSSTIIANQSSTTSSTSSSSTLWMSTQSSPTSESSASTVTESSETSSTSSTFSEQSSQSVEGEMSAMMGHAEDTFDFRGDELESQVISFGGDGLPSPSMGGTFHGFYWYSGGYISSATGSDIEVHACSSGLALIGSSSLPSTTDDGWIYYGDPRTGQRQAFPASRTGWVVVSVHTGKIVFDLADIYHASLCPLDWDHSYGTCYVDFQYDPDDDLIYLAFANDAQLGSGYLQHVVCYDPVAREIKWTKQYQGGEYGYSYGRISIQLAHGRLYVLYTGDNNGGASPDDGAMWVEGITKGPSGGSVAIAARWLFNNTYPGDSCSRSWLFLDEYNGFLGIITSQDYGGLWIEWMDASGNMTGDYGNHLIFTINGSYDGYAKVLGQDSEGYLIVVGDITGVSGMASSSGHNGFVRVRGPSAINGSATVDTSIKLPVTGGSLDGYSYNYFKLLDDNDWVYNLTFDGTTQIDGVNVSGMYRINMVDGAIEGLSSHNRSVDWPYDGEIGGTIRRFTFGVESTSSVSSESAPETSSSSLSEVSTQSDTPNWESYLDTSPDGSDYSWSQDFGDFNSGPYSYASYNGFSYPADNFKRSAMELTFGRFSGDPVTMYLKQNGNDYCRVYVDGEVVLEHSQIASSWTQYSIAVPPGEHTIRWEAWDEFGTSGQLKVDDVVLPVTDDQTTSTTVSEVTSQSSLSSASSEEFSSASLDTEQRNIGENMGFETGIGPEWVQVGSQQLLTQTLGQAHSGTYSAGHNGSGNSTKYIKQTIWVGGYESLIQQGLVKCDNSIWVRRDHSNAYARIRIRSMDQHGNYLQTIWWNTSMRPTLNTWTKFEQTGTGVTLDPATKQIEIELSAYRGISGAYHIWLDDVESWLIFNDLSTSSSQSVTESTESSSSSSITESLSSFSSESLSYSEQTQSSTSLTFDTASSLSSSSSSESTESSSSSSTVSEVSTSSSSVSESSESTVSEVTTSSSSTSSVTPSSESTVSDVSTSSSVSSVTSETSPTSESTQSEVTTSSSTVSDVSTASTESSETSSSSSTVSDVSTASTESSETSSSTSTQSEVTTESTASTESSSSSSSSSTVSDVSTASTETTETSSSSSSSSP